MNLVQMLQNKGILVESPRSIESMDLEKKFEYAISWNIVRNAFFNVKLSRETINFLKSNEVDFVDFLRMMRERGWCLAQRTFPNTSLWVIPALKNADRCAMWCVLVRCVRDEKTPVHVIDIRYAYNINDRGIFHGTRFNAPNLVVQSLPILKTLELDDHDGVEFKGKNEEGKYDTKFVIAPFHVIYHLQGNGMEVPYSIVRALEDRASRFSDSMSAKKLDELRSKKVLTHVEMRLMWENDDTLRRSSPMLQILLSNMGIDPLLDRSRMFWWSIAKRWFSLAFDGDPKKLIGFRINLKESRATEPHGFPCFSEEGLREKTLVFYKD